MNTNDILNIKTRKFFFLKINAILSRKKRNSLFKKKFCVRFQLKFFLQKRLIRFVKGLKMNGFC